MRTISFTKVFLAVILMTSLFYAVSLVRQKMNRIRAVEDLADLHRLNNAPPLTSFTTIALGGFRGLFADVLFLRLHSMQEQERYFEMPQLAAWIVNLQPRFTGATSFLAWNMAYNISVMFNRPEDRWRWVQNGIQLIRDHALLHNNSDPKLYRELGWIYQHKIGQNLDDANQYYQRQLAQQFIRIMGNDRKYDWSKWAKTAANEKELILNPDDSGKELRKVLSELGTTLDKLEHDFRSNQRFSKEVRKILEENNLVDILEDYLRIRWLKAELKLDARLIHQLVEAYGYLDFRLPDAYAIYWATQGLKHSDKASSLDLKRMIFQSLKNAFLNGKLIYLEENSEIFQTTANIELANSAKQAYLDALTSYPENQSVLAGYENFMIDAIVMLHIFGKKKQARSFLNEMKGFELVQNPSRFQFDPDTFVIRELAGDIKLLTRQQAQSVIQGLILQSCNALIFGDHQRAEGFNNLAEHVHARYMKTIKTSRDQERRGLGDFASIKHRIVDRFRESLSPAARREWEGME